MSTTRSVRPRAARGLYVQRFRLVATAGKDRGKSFVSGGARTVIGSQPGTDVTLSDPTVSGFHCEISVDRGRATVKDLGSHNGTVIDGVIVHEAEIRSGQTLTLGETRLRFDLGSERVKVPLSEEHRFGDLVGESAAMRMVFTLLARAAASDGTVLLEGETGTGKEAAAEAIHAAGARKRGPFVVVDCGAIPSQLLESELFGHERGAFTGAVKARAGAFEAAAGGTVFLDEIGELPHELQPKLLRALERREAKRVGATRYAPIDVRVIAATNRNLRREMNEKRFRPDLYFRLAVIELRLPPLRERLEDLPLLVEEILARAGASERAEGRRLADPAFLAELGRHPWPGNVRELRNYVERCLALGDEAPLGDDEPAGDEDPPVVDTSQPLRAERERWLRRLEKRYVEELLELHRGNVSAAAKGAGLGRVQMYRLLWRHGLR